MTKSSTTAPVAVVRTKEEGEGEGEGEEEDEGEVEVYFAVARRRTFEPRRIWMTSFVAGREPSGKRDFRVCPSKGSETQVLPWPAEKDQYAERGFSPGSRSGFAPPKERQADDAGGADGSAQTASGAVFAGPQTGDAAKERSAEETSAAPVRKILSTTSPLKE